MDLKPTKVTAPAFTAKELRSWVLQFGIEKASAELKNTSVSLCQRYLRNQDRGLSSEQSVIRYFQIFGAALLAQRFKTKIGEIDLIFLRQNQFVLVEVKTLDSPWRSFHAVSTKQLNVLRRNKFMLEIQFANQFSDRKTDFICYVAWVNRAQQVELLTID